MTFTVRRMRLAAALCLMGLAAASGGCGPAQPIRVTILSGANVHDWKATTPFLERMYNESGRFRVVGVVNDVTKVTAATFAPCDVIVSNWTCHPVMTGGPWTPEGRKAFGDAIRGGKGMVSFHAACAACNDWEDFQEISGLTWKWDHTSHTAYHTFKVVIGDAPSPITQGMADFWITDELYQNMAKMSKSDFRTHAKAFAAPDWHGTGKWEPMLITTQLGKGRGVNFLLGHDVATMRNIAWQTIMLRSTEWAATGRVTIPLPPNWPTSAAAASVVGVDLDAALNAAAGYAFGRTREPLFTVEQLVIDAASRTDPAGLAHRAQLAAKLGDTIAACGTPEAKAFFCRQLALIGTPGQVPAIAPLVADERTSTMACYALDRIPGPDAARALRDALPAMQGRPRIGVINSIGNRADAAAVGLLAPLLSDADAEVATAAAAALGRIADANAMQALDAAMNKVTPAARPAVADAYLRCADALLAAGEAKPAADACQRMLTPKETLACRAAALRGLLRADAAKGLSCVEDALADEDPAAQRMAAQILQELSAGKGAGLPAQLLAKWRQALRSGDAGTQFRAVRVLGAWPTSEPLPDVLALARHAAAEPARSLLAVAVVNLCARAIDESPEKVTECVDLAMGLDLPAAQRQRLLQLLARNPSPATMRMALGYADRPDLRDDACRVAVQAASVLVNTDKADVAAAMRKILPMCDAPDLKQQADAVLRKAIKPTNLALDATASSPDGLDADGASGPDQAAIDGNPDTFWDETDNQPLYRLVVTFKQPTDVSAVSIRGHAYRSYSPRDFDILCDDKVVRSVRNAEYAQDTNEVFFAFPRTKCKALELRITGCYGGSPGIRELEIYDVSEADAAVLAPPPSAPASFAWRRTDSEIALMRGDRIVWQLHFGNDLSRPFFHPVNLTDGTELVWLAPPDHPHHRALWFAWKDINGVDYWAEPTPQAPNGETEITSYSGTPGDDFGARIEMELSYHPPGLPPVLTEKRVIEISPPDKDGGYVIDWDATFTAGPEDVHLKGGTAGGGYAGLSVRFARDCRSPLLVDSEGRKDGDCGGVTKNTHGQRARWADLSFTPGVGQPAGIAILDHPSNLRYPSQWHNIVDARTPFVYFSPAPLWSEPYTLPAGNTLTLRYRILVHAGRADPAAIEQAWKAWADGAR